jgi:hypothetical protein
MIHVNIKTQDLDAETRKYIFPEYCHIITAGDCPANSEGTLRWVSGTSTAAFSNVGLVVQRFANYLLSSYVVQEVTFEPHAITVRVGADLVKPLEEQLRAVDVMIHACTVLTIPKTLLVEVDTPPQVQAK